MWRSLLALSLFGLAACGGAQTPATLGYIDLELAMRQSADGQAAQGRLRSEFEARQRELDQRTAQLRQVRERLEQGAGPIAQAQGQAQSCEAMIAYVQQLHQLQRDYEVYQQQLQLHEQTAVQEIVQRMRRVAERLADEHGVVVVLDSEAYVAPGSRRVDLTQELIERYNAEYGNAH